MRLDYLTIFPDYLAPLQLSLPGKAIESGLLEIAVHDIRQWTHDRHNTVDDTPYGGGAGMVMKPEPFGEAFDELDIAGATVIVPTPSGRPFTQADAEDLATKDRLVFLCGRYEGIDQRVFDHAASIADVREVSLGDYVLNGGEVAALAITEAVVRLIPGFMGNAESLVEESHQDGLLEYPSYTKPKEWRGREVPEILLSGNHGAIADWRLEQRRVRTAARRPDLLSAGEVASASSLTPERAIPADAAELLVLTRSCWVNEALANETLDLPHFHETVDEMRDSFGTWETWVFREGGRIVASVRGRLIEDEWHIGRVMVAVGLEGRGIGQALLAFIESRAPEGAAAYELFTGARNKRNQRFYIKSGYRIVAGDKPPGTVRLRKVRQRDSA
jgi:tRNA (guanine37-N1)-methyltransferase